jgi:large subunit ribosomal protein L35
VLARGNELPRRAARPVEATLERAKHEEKVMPKLKTKRGAAKRFRAKGNGGFKSGHAHMRHILTKKSPKRKRKLTRTMQVHESDVEGLRRLLPYV